MFLSGTWIALARSEKRNAYDNEHSFARVRERGKHLSSAIHRAWHERTAIARA
jgi:hypothetical protein